MAKKKAARARPRPSIGKHASNRLGQSTTRAPEVQASSPNSKDIEDNAPGISVAVIGDVTNDWAFVSREPAPSRVPELKPWARDMSTHLYAFPSGAWMLGHMLQGALTNPPIFERVSTVSIKPSSRHFPTRIILKGDIELPKNSLRISLQAKFPQAFRILLNDEPIPLTDVNNNSISFQQLTKAPLNLEVNKPRDPSQRTKVQMSLLCGDIRFQPEQDSHPGHFHANQIGRVYEADNIVIDSGRYICTMLEIRHCSIVTTDVLKSRIEGTITIVPTKTWQSLDLGNYIEVILSPENAETSLTLRKATIDVTYGTLTASTTTTDRGKLNPPLITDPRNVAQESVKMRCVHPNKDMRLFFYESPLDSLNRPDPAHVVYTLSELKQFERYDGQKGPLKVYRRVEYHGTAGPEIGYPAILDYYYPNATGRIIDHPVREYKPELRKPEIERPLGVMWSERENQPRLIVIDDEGLGFGNRPRLWEPFIPSGVDGDPTLKNSWVIIKASQWLDCKNSTLLKRLKERKALGRTIVVISGESLRKGLTGETDKPGIKLSKTVSWEQTVQDFSQALLNDALGILGECGHVLVRLGMEGAIYATPNHVVSLHYDARRIEGEYAPSGQFGEFPGLSSVFTSAIASRVARSLVSDPTGKAVAGEIDQSVPYGLSCIRRYFDLGYGPTHDTIARYAELMLPTSQVFKTGRIAHLSDDGIHRFLKCAINPEVIVDCSSDWSLLSDALDGASKQNKIDTVSEILKPSLSSKSHYSVWQRAVEATKLGRWIVLRGVKRAFSGEKWSFPYATFGKLVSVDREEIEGLRSVRNLLAEYNRFKGRDKPLSMAVFGPPGSGKSFGVKEIARGVMDEDVVEHVFNMGQFSSFSDVTKLLLEVRNDSLERKMPLVFFDEFDSRYEGKPLGWLKYFLAPMQDGRFQHESALLGIGRAIFVFAGGVADSHSHFRDSRTWQIGVTGGARREDLYSSAKGPDFHSRLRGFLDIKGINPKFASAAEERRSKAPRATDDRFATEDFSFVVRRAVLVRQMIEHSGKAGGGGILDVEGNAEIDRDILDALLLCDQFRHGVRSLQAVFDMSSIYKERAFTKTSLPSFNQLTMHVDDTFYAILRRQYAEGGSRIIEEVLKLKDLEGQYE